MAPAEGDAVDVHAGRERGELQVAASVERQLDDALVVDDLTDRAVLGGEQRRAAGHLDRLVDGAGFEREVGARHLLHLQHQTAPRLGLEPLQLDDDGVGRRRQRRHRIDAGFVADHVPRGTGGRVGDADRRARDNAARRVGDRPGDLARALGERDGRQRQEHHDAARQSRQACLHTILHQQR